MEKNERKRNEINPFYLFLGVLFSVLIISSLQKTLDKTSSLQISLVIAISLGIYFFSSKKRKIDQYYKVPSVHKLANLLLIIGVAISLLSLFHPFVRIEDYYRERGYRMPNIFLFYVGLVLVGLSFFNKKFYLKLRVLSIILSLIPLIILVSIFPIKAPETTPGLDIAELAYGVYVYAIGVALIGLSVIVSARASRT